MNESKKPKLLQQIRIAVRSLNYALATEKTYVYWAYRFIIFNNKRHPKEMDSKEVSDFLSHLAVKWNVSPSTQNQALCALVYFYKHVLEQPLVENTINAVRARAHRNLPVVLSVPEVKRVLNELKGLPKLMAQVNYGTALRKNEVRRLRVKDIDFDRNQITVKRGKGRKDRPLPEACKNNLIKQLDFVKQLHLKDRREQINGVELPYALERKEPNAS